VGFGLLGLVGLGRLLRCLEGVGAGGGVEQLFEVRQGRGFYGWRWEAGGDVD